MAENNYRRLEDKLDKMRDQLELIQQNIVELRTEKVSTCEKLDANKAEMISVQKKVNEMEDKIDNLNTKIAVIAAGASFAVTIIVILINHFLGAM